MKKMTAIFIHAIAFTAFCSVMTSCSFEEHEGGSKSKHEVTSPVTKAVAVLHPTEGSQVEGTVTFTAVPGGVKIVADVKNLKPGKHGFHVHEHGDCSAHDASSAGGHFNPNGAKHGGPGTEERHAGDMGNLVANEDGHAYYERIDDLMKLDGPDSIVGLSVIVHADEDDLKTQPTGNSGARIACGVINP